MSNDFKKSYTTLNVKKRRVYTTKTPVSRAK